MLADIEAHGNFILSAACADFALLEKYYKLIVYLETPKDERICRIRQRSIAKFGSRVLPGGDMYEQEEKFFAFAAQRTPEKIDNWIKNASCPVLHIDSTRAVDDIAAEVLSKYIQN